MILKITKKNQFNKHKVYNFTLVFFYFCQTLSNLITKDI